MILGFCRNPTVLRYDEADIMTTGSYWLSAKRLRAHGLILALAMWSVYIWILATPGLRDRNNNLKGTDFLHFYTLGSLANEHDGAYLYDMKAQTAVASQRVPAAAGVQYLPLYPPQVSILFAPFARLSYGRALVGWWAISALIYGICCYTVWRACPNLKDHGGLVALLAISFPAFFNLIAWGQTSVLALACFTALFFLLRGRHEFLAGLAFGCLIFKPQLAVASAIVFIAVGLWRVAVGAATSGAAQLAVGVLYYGTAPLREWLTMLLHARSVLTFLEPRPYQTHCLRTFWTMLIPRPGPALALYVFSLAAALVVTVSLWRRCNRVPLSLRYSALLVTTVLVSPHLTVYDLVILAPALLLLGDWILSCEETAVGRRMGTILYLVYALPLVGPLARWTHVQLSVVAMALLLYLLWKSSRLEDAGSEAASTATIA